MLSGQAERNLLKNLTATILKVQHPSPLEAYLETYLVRRMRLHKDLYIIRNKVEGPDKIFIIPTAFELHNL
jgi:hypothetical protein